MSGKKKTWSFLSDKLEEMLKEAFRSGYIYLALRNNICYFEKHQQSRIHDYYFYTYIMPP